MSEWNKIVHQGVDTLDKAVEKFGAELIDKEALQPAFDNFQMRLSPNVLEAMGIAANDAAAIPMIARRDQPSKPR